MKTPEEIEQLAEQEFDSNEKNIDEFNAFKKGYTQCQEDMKPLLNDLFDLWERLAEAGDLSIGLNFNKKYDELKKLLNKQD